MYIDRSTSSQKSVRWISQGVEESISQVLNLKFSKLFSIYFDFLRNLGSWPDTIFTEHLWPTRQGHEKVHKILWENDHPFLSIPSFIMAFPLKISFRKGKRRVKYFARKILVRGKFIKYCNCGANSENKLKPNQKKYPIKTSVGE